MTWLKGQHSRRGSSAGKPRSKSPWKAASTAFSGAPAISTWRGGLQPGGPDAVTKVEPVREEDVVLLVKQIATAPERTYRLIPSRFPPIDTFQTVTARKTWSGFSSSRAVDQ